MSTTRCPSCQHRVSTEAATCPGCGHPLRETAGTQLAGCVWIAIAIPAVFMAYAMITSNAGMGWMVLGIGIIVLIAGLLNRQDGG